MWYCESTVGHSDRTEGEGSAALGLLDPTLMEQLDILNAKLEHCYVTMKHCDGRIGHNDRTEITVMEQLCSLALSWDSWAWSWDS